MEALATCYYVFCWDGAQLTTVMSSFNKNVAESIASKEVHRTSLAHYVMELRSKHDLMGRRDYARGE
jgi:hypothetical protein